jgi:tetratricopeptide (TPR) repeat protein
MFNSVKSALLAACLLLTVVGCGETESGETTPTTEGAAGAPEVAAGPGERDANRSAIDEPARSNANADPRPADTDAQPAWNDEMDQVVALISRERYDEARQRTSAAIERWPASGKWRFLHALTDHRAQRYQRARDDFERAIELEPAFAHTYHFYGYCAYYLGDLDAAHDAFQRHLSYAPNEGDSHFGLGLVHFDRDQLDEAESAFQRAIALQEGMPNRVVEVAKAYIRLSDVYVRRDALDDARAALETAIELYPQHFEAYLKLSRVLARLGDEEGAAAAQAQYEAIRERVAEQPGGDRR